MSSISLVVTPEYCVSIWSIPWWVIHCGLFIRAPVYHPLWNWPNIIWHVSLQSLVNSRTSEIVNQNHRIALKFHRCSPSVLPRHTPNFWVIRLFEQEIWRMWTTCSFSWQKITKMCALPEIISGRKQTMCISETSDTITHKQEETLHQSAALLTFHCKNSNSTKAIMLAD